MTELICNTSVLQYLHQIGLLHILPALSSSISVPSAVMTEVAAGRALGIDLPDVPSLNWITIRTPTNTPPLPGGRILGAGESAVLWLALETPPCVAALDDRNARRVAHQLGLRFTGTLGLLVDAKRHGLVGAVRPFLDELNKRGFYLASRLKATILRSAGETP